MTAPVYAIDAARLSALYTALNCDGCGTALTPDPAALWLKSGCGYFCPACALARGLTPTERVA
jgi:hypothetical protein